MRYLFDKIWFGENQKILLSLLNAPIIRIWFRWALRIKRGDCNEKITEIGPNHFSWGDKLILEDYLVFKDGHKELFDRNKSKHRKLASKLKTEKGLALQRTADFRGRNIFSERLFYAFKPFWLLCHLWDVLIANRLKPAWNLGFDDLTVQPSAKDTLLYEYNATTNYGSDIELQVFDRAGLTQRSLLEFDISGLPAGVTITGVSLLLNYERFAYNDPVGKTIWAYKLTRTDWVELQATWNIYKTANNWTTPGGDYVTSDPSGGSTTFPASYGWMSWNVLAIVQNAYSGSIPAEFLMKFETEGLPDETKSIGLFYSNDYTTDPSLCPKLVITYCILHTQTLPVTEVSVVTLSKILIWARSLAVTEVSTASLSKIASFFRSLAATEVSVATLSKVASYFKTLAGTEVSIASLSPIKTFCRNLVATVTAVVRLKIPPFISRLLKPTTSFGKEGKPTSGFTKQPKPTTNFTKEDKPD